MQISVSWRREFTAFQIMHDVSLCRKKRSFHGLVFFFLLFHCAHVGLEWGCYRVGLKGYKVLLAWNFLVLVEWQAIYAKKSILRAVTAIAWSPWYALQWKGEIASMFLEEEIKYCGCLGYNATYNTVGCYSSGNQSCSCKCHFFFFFFGK